MKSFDGYLKLKLGNDYILLAGGGELSLPLALSRLYSDDSSYEYGSANPYYAHLSYNTNSDTRWYLRVSPESPKEIAVDWAYGVDWTKIANKPSSYTPASHTQSYTTLTGSGTTANQAIVSNGANNGWELKTLGTNAFLSYTYKTATGVVNTGWVNNTTDDKIVPTMSFMAYWNGRYSSTGSNLLYCDRGRFGTIITKADSDYWPLFTDSYPCLRPGSSNNWIQIGTSNTSYGILPSTSGGAGSGHNYIGTSSWYWKYAYIDQIYGYLNGNISGNAATVGGYSVSSSATANTVALRQANGYLYAVYYNASNSYENIASYTSYVMFKDSNGWQRCTTKTLFQSWLGLGDRAYDSTSYLPLSGGTLTGKVTVNSSHRDAGMYGVYDSHYLGHVWSMGTSYAISADGKDPASLYGMGYFHTNWSNSASYNTNNANKTALGTYAGGHQIGFFSNGVLGTSIGFGGNVWTSGGFIKSGSSNSYVLLGGGGHATIASINSLVTFPYSSLAHYGATSSTSYYKISINSYTSWMLSFVVRVYLDYKSYDIRFSGYNYGSHYWHSPSASLINSTTTDITVYFGYDSAYHLWVAIPGSSYAGVSVYNAVNGYTQVSMTEKDLFTVSAVSSLSGTIQSTQTVYSPLHITSSNRPGTTKLYRYDNDSDYSVMTDWTGTYWRLRGFSGNTYHAGCLVAYADSAGSASTANSVAWTGVSSQMQGGNEFNIPDSGFSSTNFWINYLPRNSRSNNSTLITNYCFGNLGKGYASLNAANYYTTSDKSKKQNISSFSEHIRKFQLKDTKKWHYGVIAQEVEEMFRDGEEGNMTVNYNSVLSYYIGQLENRVKELEEKVRQLENLNK